MIRTFLLLTALFGASAIAAEKPVKLFLLGGQSNMDGCGRWNELPENLKQTPANVRIWDNKMQEWKKAPIKPLHKMTEQQAVREFGAFGFAFVENKPGLPWQHLLVFERAIPTNKH